MDYERLTSPCGIDCFDCELYESNVTSELQRAIAAYKGVEPDTVVCGGCRETGCIMLDGACETKACVERHGVTYCFECSDFPLPLAPSLLRQGTGLPTQLQALQSAADPQGRPRALGGRRGG